MNTNNSSNTLIKQLTRIAREVSRRRYGNPDEVFELAKTEQYPEDITTLAESLGMMIVKVEAREYRLEQIIAKLREIHQNLTKEYRERLAIAAELKQYREHLKDILERRTRMLRQSTIRLKQEIEERQKAEKEKRKLVNELQTAVQKAKSLRHLIPVCPQCTRIRTDRDYWQKVEDYYASRTTADLQQNLCPSCRQKTTAAADTNTKPASNS